MGSKRPELTTPNTGKSREELERIFINRPLEPYIRDLSAWSDFIPIFNQAYKWYSDRIDEITSIVQEVLHLINFQIILEKEEALKIHRVKITDRGTLDAIKKAVEEQIRQHYIKALSRLETNCEYEDIFNEYLENIQYAILENPVIEIENRMEGYRSGVYMTDANYEECRENAAKQLNELKSLKGTIDYGGINDILRLLAGKQADFNNQLFQDLYTFCAEIGLISEEQQKTHSINSRPTAQIDFIRAAYNRLKKTGTLDRR